MSLAMIFVVTLSDIISLGLLVLLVFFLGAAWLLVSVSDWNLRRKARKAARKEGAK